MGSHEFLNLRQAVCEAVRAEGQACLDDAYLLASLVRDLANMQLPEVQLFARQVDADLLLPLRSISASSSPAELNIAKSTMVDELINVRYCNERLSVDVADALVGGVADFYRISTEHKHPSRPEALVEDTVRENARVQEQMPVAPTPTPVPVAPAPTPAPVAPSTALESAPVSTSALDPTPKPRKKSVVPIVAALAAVALVVGIVVVVLMNNNSTAPSPNPGPGGEGTETPSVSNTKVGLICLHDDNNPTDANYINGFKEAMASLGLNENDYVIKTGVDENSMCFEVAEELVDEGCAVVFGDSYGYEDYLIQAAKEYPDVEFCLCGGVKAHTEELNNYHNAYASIHDGRYLAGVAAGIKMQDMISSGKISNSEAKVGFVGSFSYAEVISSYTAFYLGVKSCVPSATMDVVFTSSWYDEVAEKEVAQQLIDEGCVVISQYSDSMGAPTACEQAGVLNVPYNGSTIDACPNTYLVSTRIDWAPFFKYAVGAVASGSSFDTDWTGTLGTGSVVLEEPNGSLFSAIAADDLDRARSYLENGNAHTFDTSTFTVDGSTLSSYRADVDYDNIYEPDTEVVANGYFHESEYRSFPYFDVQIDGISLLNTAF